VKPALDPVGRAGSAPPALGCDCFECSQVRRHIKSPAWEESVRRAETLLRRFLTEQQIADWEQHRAIVAIGSLGGKYQLTPQWSPDHRSVVREDGLGISVWPDGLTIQADWLLAMVLELQADEHRVLAQGCHSPNKPHPLL
jgi:hypothetical protein